MPSKLDPYKPLIDTRLKEYPKLTAVRLFKEVRAAGYPGSYNQVKRYVRKVRPRPPEEPVVRFETAPGRQGQVDFAHFRLPWGKRYALIVVLGYSRLLWVQCYTRQTMKAPMHGLESSFSYFGGGHEHGLRSGTLNVPGIVGMATALELAVTLQSAETKRLHDLTDWMFSRLSQDIGSVHRYGHPDLRLPHNLNIGIHGVRAKALVVNLPDLAFSTGSACTTQKAEPSHVLQAIGLPADRLRESIRFGLGRETSRQDVEYALGRIQEVALRIRGAHAVATA